MSTPTTPAEAAHDAYWEGTKFLARPTIEAWPKVAQAAINAQVAEGLPTLKEITDAWHSEGLGAKETQALFTSRFAKLQAESENNLGRWMRLVRDVARELHTENSEQIESIEVARAMIFRQIKWNRTDSTERFAKLQSERDEAQLNVNLGDARLAGIKRIHAEMIAEKDAAIADLKRENTVCESAIESLKGDVDELKAMNQKASDAFTQANLTEGSLRAQIASVFMARLEAKTKRERYVPLQEHEEMKRVAVEALEQAYSVFYDPNYLSPGTLGLASCDQMKAAITTLKGDNQ